MAWCCICQNFSTEQYAMHMTFDGSGGISIAASLVGDGLGRPPVLLAHGGGQTRRTWRKTMQQLAQHGYRSLAIDMRGHRSEEHTSELQSLMRISYAVFCLKKKKQNKKTKP